MSLRPKLGFLMGVLLASELAYGVECRCDRTNDRDTILETASQSYGIVTLKFDSPVQASGIYQGSLCQQNASHVRKVRLFMPDMGHGSSPTQLVPATAECLRVEEINFMMDGAWEIQVYQEDGTQSLLTLTI